MKALVIDISKCNGCLKCETACKDEHTANDRLPYAKLQPPAGNSWIKLNEIVTGAFSKAKKTYMLDICQHCNNAPCISACKQKAIYKRDDGIVIIDPEKCRGDKRCIDACLYNVIHFNSQLNIAQKCTFCAHLLDKGQEKPRCVESCPTGAMTFGEEAELKNLIKKAQIYNSVFNTKPIVYYIGLSNML